MFEMSTETVSRDLLKEMIAKAKARRDFKKRSKELSFFTIKKDVLPDLQGYVLASEVPIASVRGTADCPLEQFLRLAESLKERVESCGVSYEIAQSKTRFDSAKESDLELSIRHNANKGWGVMLNVDTSRPECADMVSRSALFRSLVECAGLSESVEIRCDDGKLYLESETVKSDDNFIESASMKTSDIGRCVYWASGGQVRSYDRGSITLYNFSILAFYFPRFSDFLAASKRCTEYFCSLGKVVCSEFWLNNYDGDYEWLRTFLGTNFPCNDWQVMIDGRPKYDIDDLDKMFEETDSLLLPLFVIKDRKVGEIYMDLGHDNGMSTLCFSAYTEDIDKADKVIRQIVAELSDGKAVINEEV